MRHFYREKNGDYFCIEVESRDLHWNGGMMYEGRGAALQGSALSVQTTSIHEQYLRSCKRVKKQDVPKEWLRMF